MENINDLMGEFKESLSNGRIQKAYRYIFELFTDLESELKNIQEKNITINALYHGYLDMTYIPVFTDNLKKQGLKIAIVFDYSKFKFELWLSAVNRRKRAEILKVISDSKWNRYKIVEEDGNQDAIIEIEIDGMNSFDNKEYIVTLIKRETVHFMNEIEKFIQGN